MQVAVPARPQRSLKTFIHECASPLQYKLCADAVLLADQSIGFAAGRQPWLSRACPRPQPTVTPLHDCILMICRRVCRQKLHGVLVRHVPPQRLVHTPQPYRLRTCDYLSGHEEFINVCTLVMCSPPPSFMCVRGAGDAGWSVKYLPYAGQGWQARL